MNAEQYVYSTSCFLTVNDIRKLKATKFYLIDRLSSELCYFQDIIVLQVQVSLTHIGVLKAVRTTSGSILTDHIQI